MSQTIGEKIVAAREAAGMSRNALINALGGNYRSAVWRWENGKAIPTARSLIDIARVLNVELAYFGDGAGEAHAACDHPAVAAFVERVKQLPLRHQVYLLAVVGCMVDSIVQDAGDAG